MLRALRLRLRFLFLLLLGLVSGGFRIGGCRFGGGMGSCRIVCGCLVVDVFLARILGLVFCNHVPYFLE